MKEKSTFKYTVLIQLALFILTSLAMLHRTLPTEAMQYYQWFSQQLQGTLYEKLLPLGRLSILCYFVAVIGLLRFKNHGRYLFLILPFLDLFTFHKNPSLYFSYEYCLMGLNYAAIGVTTYLMFLTPLKQVFEDNKMDPFTRIEWWQIGKTGLLWTNVLIVNFVVVSAINSYLHVGLSLFLMTQCVAGVFIFSKLLEDYSKLLPKFFIINTFASFCFATFLLMIHYELASILTIVSFLLGYLVLGVERLMKMNKLDDDYNIKQLEWLP